MNVVSLVTLAWTVGMVSQESQVLMACQVVMVLTGLQARTEGMECRGGMVVQERMEKMAKTVSSSHHIV